MNRKVLLLAVLPLLLTLALIVYIFARHGGGWNGARPNDNGDGGAAVDQAEGGSSVALFMDAQADLQAVTHLPPITLSFVNQRPGKAMEAIAGALGEHQPLELTGDSGQMVSLDAHDQPFWEVMRAIQEQVPSGFGDFQSQLILNSRVEPLRQFEIHEPAILYAKSIAYERNRKLTTDGALAAAGRYLLTVHAAIDPRVTLGRISPVQVASATDDQGRPMAGVTLVSSNVDPFGPLTARGNFWITTLAVPDVKPKPAWISLKCMVKFALLHQKPVFLMEDPQSFVGKEFTVGNRILVLQQMRPDLTVGTITFKSKDGRPITDISCNAIDTLGKANPFPVRNGEPWAFQRDPKIPFQLQFSIAAIGPDLAIPIELKQVPLP